MLFHYLLRKRMFQHSDTGIVRRAISTGPCHVGLLTRNCFSRNETDVNSKIWRANEGTEKKDAKGKVRCKSE